MSNFPMTPATIEGTDPGSIYKVIFRTANGYIAIRRLSKYFYRLRAERFDKAPIISINDTQLIMYVAQTGLQIKANGSRVTGVTDDPVGGPVNIDVLQAYTRIYKSK